MRTLRKFMAAIPVVFLAATCWAQSAFNTAYRYDVGRQLVGVISPQTDGAFQAIRNTYDAKGRITKIEMGSLAAWQSEAVLPVNWPNFTVIEVTDKSYDALGRLLTEKHSSGTGADVILTQSSYDNAGRLECTAIRMNAAAYSSLPASACTLGAQGTDGPDRITRRVYDVAGELVNEQRAYGTASQQNFATYAYTANGRRDWVQDSSGNRSDFTYDGFGSFEPCQLPSAHQRLTGTEPQ